MLNFCCCHFPTCSLSKMRSDFRNQTNFFHFRTTIIFISIRKPIYNRKNYERLILLTRRQKMLSISKLLGKPTWTKTKSSHKWLAFLKFVYNATKYWTSQHLQWRILHVLIFWLFQFAWKIISCAQPDMKLETTVYILHLIVSFKHPKHSVYSSVTILALHVSKLIWKLHETRRKLTYEYAPLPRIRVV